MVEIECIGQGCAGEHEGAVSAPLLYVYIVSLTQSLSTISNSVTP